MKVLVGVHASIEDANHGDCLFVKVVKGNVFTDSDVAEILVVTGSSPAKS